METIINDSGNVNKPSLKWSAVNILDMTSINGKNDYNKQEQQWTILLKEFRTAVQDILESHHDDQFLLRWLKARDFDLIKAEKMIRESFSFRKRIGANTILTDYEHPEVYVKHPITAFLGFDKENSPVRLFMIGTCDYKGFVYSLRTTDMMKLLTYFLEHDMNLLQEKKKKGETVEMKSTYILDFTEFTLKKFYDKSVINAGIQLITMYQDNYPETLKRAYLVNVPSYFTWVFNIFKPFLNSVTLSKIKIFRTDEWQNELMKDVDPNLVPAFLGGKLTDPDGNPKCTSLINWKLKINPSYYLSQNCDEIDDPAMKTTTVPQRGTFQVPVVVTTSGSILKWVFMTREYNIRFGVFYRKGAKSSKMESVIPVENVDCQVVPEENELLCKNTGTYILHFDNSYSWMTAKQLTYKVEVETPDKIETNNN